MGFKRRSFRAALLTIFLLFRCANTTDILIKHGLYISDAGNKALVSSDGNFKLGFFSPGNSQNRYVGIWFNKVSKQTVVWVANRDAPIKNTTGFFKINDEGNIVILDSNNESLTVWSSNVSMLAITANSTAKLLPSGNLVLITTNGSDRTGTVMWQSFDHPTDTALPGMKLGLDRRTGLNRVLTSWKSDDDPSRGDFSGGVDLHGSSQFYSYKGSGR